MLPGTQRRNGQFLYLFDTAALNASLGLRSAPIALRPCRVMGGDRRAPRGSLLALWGIRTTAHIRQDRRRRRRRARYQMRRSLPCEPIRLPSRGIYRDNRYRQILLLIW